MLKICVLAIYFDRRDGSESEAYLHLPPARLDTHMTELVEQHSKELDSQIQSFKLA